VALNGRQITKIVLTLAVSLYLIFAVREISPAAKAALLAVMWLATAAAVWFRRTRV
jgi:hypothetical protein